MYPYERYLVAKNGTLPGQIDIWCALGHADHQSDVPFVVVSIDQEWY